jgi:2-polyprenyl-3-methyl-5-hydroxy-6-metoxy-1,4-benzoquinol methylase
MFQKILSEKLVAFYHSHASSKKTLDVGSRRGRHSVDFPNNVTIDIDPASDPDVVADAHHLPFPDASFEVVICREVLEHVLEPQVVMKELYRVLVPGGTLLLSTRFLFPIHEAPHDHWRFTRYTLENLASDFTDVTVVEDTLPAESIGALLQRFAWQSDFRFSNKIAKFGLLLLAEIFFRSDWLVTKQYGNVNKSVIVGSAFSNGYFLVAKK